MDHYTISWIFCTSTYGSRTPLPEKQDELPYQAITPIYEEALSIRLHNSASHKYPLHHTWKNLATVGSAGDILLPNVQQMLLRLKKDTGVRYLRFNGIFFDRLLVASADASGNPVYNFAYVDMVLDFLHSIGLRPWIQLSFMPRVLALHPNKYLFNDNVSRPRSCRSSAAADSLPGRESRRQATLLSSCWQNLAPLSWKEATAIL